MLGKRDIGERRSDNLSIARQEVDAGCLKVQTIKDFHGRTWVIMDIQIPPLVIDRRMCLDHVCVISNCGITHLRVGDIYLA